VRLEADGEQYNLGDALGLQCCGDSVCLRGRLWRLFLSNGDNGCRRMKRRKGTDFVRVQVMDDQ
jgi:hypothetical protein